jgi:hypothetical protein
MGSILDHDAKARRRHHQNRPTEIESGGAGISSPPAKKHKKKRRRRHRREYDDLPFSQLVIRVGATLFLACCLLVIVYRQLWPSSRQRINNNRNKLEYDDDDGVYDPQEQISAQEVEILPSESTNNRLNELWRKVEAAEKGSKEPKTPPPIPTFDLSEASQWDAFGILEHFETQTNQSTLFWNVARELRAQFAEIYGGENAARMLLDQGLTTFFESSPETKQIPLDIHHTACRFQKAREENRPFRFAFAGYSVTAGRGNLFNQSFPFQMQNILNTVVQLAGITQGLQVRNAAIGGIAAFPYAWCFENFLGLDADVISWDYSMNEAGGVPEGLEAYLRHMLTKYSSSIVPKLIVKDTHMATLRRRVLHDYADLLRDAIVMHTDPAVLPFLEREEEHRPVGFQDWRKFGAPYGAPGQTRHHPAVKEHELIGWILAMHFLTALEYNMSQGTNLSCPELSAKWSLSPPVSGHLANNTDTKYDPILFGHEISNDKWEIKPIHCRTTFQPILSGDLSELIVNGSIAEDLPLLFPKSQMFYNQGWVLDMSEGEKGAKRKLSLYENDLGFVDSKEAYYGIFESPEMTLLLPYSERPTTTLLPKIKDSARKWYESIVICQVNESRNDKACNFASDIGLTIGGVNVTNISDYLMKDSGTLYLGKPVCSHLPIPEGAILTSHNELVADSGSYPLEVDQLGLEVQISVINPHIVHVGQACSLSHVVWEEKQ